jgi:DNA helicase II / ATP-dependent DNA helicase PcrA
MDLTSEQMEAVTASDRKLVILAGPGTGKTTVIAERVRHLIGLGEDPQAIAVATFTRKAAGVLRERIGNPLVRIGTFHSLIMELMKHAGNNLRVISESGSMEVIDSCAERLGFAVNGTYYKKSRAHYAKLIKAAWHDRSVQDEVANLYMSTLAMDGCIDYEGILATGLAMAKQGKFDFLKHFIVDEAQDNDGVQWGITNAIAEHASVSAVGQEAQCIYRWRGARPQFLHESDWKRCELTKSFRCTNDALIAINGLSIADVQMKHGDSDSTMIATKTPLIEIVRELLSEMYSPADIAILARYNTDVDENIRTLSDAGLPVSTSVAPPEGFIKELLQYMSNPYSSTQRQRVVSLFRPYAEITSDSTMDIICSQMSDDSCGRIVSNWLRGIGVMYGPSEVLGAMNLPSCLNSDVGYYKSEFSGETLESFESSVNCITNLELSPTPGITVITMHAAKGMEFPAVVITDRGTQRETDDERRLVYVAFSRASEKLIIQHDRDLSGVVGELVEGVLSER